MQENEGKKKGPQTTQARENSAEPAKKKKRKQTMV